MMAFKIICDGDSQNGKYLARACFLSDNPMREYCADQTTEVICDKAELVIDYIYWGWPITTRLDGTVEKAWVQCFH